VVKKEEGEGAAQHCNGGGGEVEDAALQVADDELVFVDLQQCV
jgi:hypothetical protein